MTDHKKARIQPSEITPPEVWRDRRRLLKAAVAAGIGGVGLGALGIRAALQPDADGPERRAAAAAEAEELVPTSYQHITTYNNFYEFGTSKDAPAERAGTLVTDPWSVKVDGECEKPGSIGIEDLLQLFPQQERIYRLRCVEAWAMVVPWMGFPLADLLKRFQPTSNARFVAFETLYDPEQMPGQKYRILDWPYREALRIDEAMHPLTLLATGLYGEVLPKQNGAPLRLVVPWKYGFKSIKSIVRISFTREMPHTSWSALAPDEYGFYANVNPEVDHPRWSQKSHRLLGTGLFSKRQPTLPFNGYAEEVAGLYRDMDLRRWF